MNFFCRRAVERLVPRGNIVLSAVSFFSLINLIVCIEPADQVQCGQPPLIASTLRT